MRRQYNGSEGYVKDQSDRYSRTKVPIEHFDERTEINITSRVLDQMTTESLLNQDFYLRNMIRMTREEHGRNLGPY